MSNLTSNRARGMSGNRHLKKTDKLTKDSIARYLRACEKAKLKPATVRLLLPCRSWPHRMHGLSKAPIGAFKRLLTGFHKFLICFPSIYKYFHRITYI